MGGLCVNATGTAQAATFTDTSIYAPSTIVKSEKFGIAELACDGVPPSLV